MLTNSEIEENIKKYCSFDIKGRKHLPTTYINTNSIITQLSINNVYPFTVDIITAIQEGELSRVRSCMYMFMEDFIINPRSKDSIGIKTVIALLTVIDFLSNSANGSFRSRLFIVKNENYTFAEIHLHGYNDMILLINLNDPKDDYIVYKSPRYSYSSDYLQLLILPKERLKDMKVLEHDNFYLFKINKTKIKQVCKENSIFTNYNYQELFFLAYCYALLNRRDTLPTAFNIIAIESSRCDNPDWFTRINSSREEKDRKFEFADSSLTSFSTFRCDVNKQDNN